MVIFVRNAAIFIIAQDTRGIVRAADIPIRQLFHKAFEGILLLYILLLRIKKAFLQLN